MEKEPLIKTVVKTDDRRRIQIPSVICERVGIKPDTEYDIRLIYHGPNWIIILQPLKVK